MTARTCGKRRYPTAALARRALDSIRRHGTRTTSGKPTRYYACPHCNGYHLTGQPR